jgi:hypothetical protein
MMELPEPDDRLNSWKEIAAFLGRTVRTVQRWEKHDGLPLRRGGPGRHRAVTASKRDISAWWERRKDVLEDAAVPQPADPVAQQRFWPAAAVAAVILISAATMLLTGRPERRDPAKADSGSGRLFAASTTEGRTASFISLGAVPVRLVLSPSADRAYVALEGEGTVAVVDLGARKVIDRFEGVERAVRVLLSADASRLFIVGVSEIVAYDVRRRTLKKFFGGGGGTIRDAYLAPDDRHIWLTLAQAGLKILDVETGGVETLPTVGCPMYLAAAPRSRRLFLAYQCGGPGGRWGHDAIEVIDEVRRVRIATQAGPPLVGSYLAVSPDEQHLWTDAGDACANPEYDQVGCPPGAGPVLHALRADKLDPLLTVRVPGQPFGSMPVFFRDGTRLLLVERGFKVLDRARGTVTEAIDIAPGPGEFTADGRSFVAVDPRNRGVRVFDNAPAPDALVLRAVATHWTGDGTANDVAGGTHAVATDPLRFAPGRYGQAFLFDDASKGVDFGRRLEPDLSTDHATSYVAWIKPQHLDVPMHIVSRSGPLGWRWWITGDGRMSFCFLAAMPQVSCDRAPLTGPAPAEPGRWSQVAVVRSASRLSLFFDGREIGWRSLAGVVDPPPADPMKASLRLGAGLDGQLPFQGLIDEVLLFRRVLSDSDLADVRRATSFEPR